MNVRWVPTSIFALVVAVFGGHFATIPETPANAPFVYVPPPGFQPVDMSTKLDANVTNAWVEPSMITRLDARVTLLHSSHTADLEDAAIAEIAKGMPSIYEKSHGQWTEARHLVHRRPDGGQVGLIVGDLKTADDVHMETMQMLFPDDKGSSIVTASFDSSSAARLSPLFEESMDQATGVKKLGKAADNWMYLAWGLGGLIFAIALQAVLMRRAAA